MKMCDSVAFVKYQKGLFVVFLTVCTLRLAIANPQRTKREFVDDQVQGYLMQFGYLSNSPHSAGALRTEESLKKAIMELQEFSGLPITGTLDEKTRKLMARPRCGLPDIESHRMRRRRRKRFMLQGQRWPYTNLTWSLRSRSLRNLNSYEVRVVLSKALDVWATHSKLTFTEIDSDRADILVYFHRGDHGDNFAFDGKGQILAHAFFPGSGRGGDAHFDEDETWLTREGDTTDEGTSLFHVAAHEFGHSLGLSHSSVEGALMYPWYQGMQNGFNYNLPEDDRLGVQSLYGATDDRLWGQRPVYETPTTTTTVAPTLPPPPPTRPTPRTRYYDPRYYPEKPRFPEKKPYPRVPMHPDRKHSKYPKSPYYPEKAPPTRYPWEPRRRYPERTTETATEPPRYPTRNDFDVPRRPGIDIPKEEAPPNTCDTSYDAISVIRRELFIFKDRYFWRIGDSGLLPNYPAEIIRMWRGLPRNLTRVDAVYERPDNKIVFFIGRHFYVYSGNSMERGYPKRLSDLGLPKSLNKIDGAMVWGHNGRTYFYSGNMYWRFDEDTMQVELDYPRDMSMWKGVGTDIDAVFQWKDGKTYFFKGKGFWKFNDLRMRVEDDEQMLSAPFWMGCSKNLQDEQPVNKAPYTVADTSSTTKCTAYLLLLILLNLGAFIT